MIRALFFDDRDQFERHKHPGSFQIEASEVLAVSSLYFYCPCGCGKYLRILVSQLSDAGDPERILVWNGSTTEPTLDGVVDLIDHWRGHLRDGYWESCA